MKKGFTLIELLAVIVILAIIGVITVPIIGNVIEESKKQALEASVRGIVEATDYFAVYNDGVYEFQFNENNKGVTPGGDSLDYTGNIDAEGKLVLDSEGKISLCLMNDDYYAYKNYNSGIVIGDRSKDSCNIGYDVLTNKYIAFLESEGSASNVYSKDEVDNLVSSINTSITNNTNEITNIKSNIETLQTSLNDYALKSELQQTNENMNVLSSSITSNKDSINIINDKLTKKPLSLSFNPDYVELISTNSAFYSDGTYYIDVAIQIKKAMAEGINVFNIIKDGTVITFNKRIDIFLKGWDSSIENNTIRFLVLTPNTNVFVVNGKTVSPGFYNMQMIISL